MSFGCSPGDFIQIAQLVKTALDRIRSAPKDFQGAAKTVQTLDTFLESIQKETQSSTSVLRREPAHGEQLAVLIQSCHDPVSRLCTILENRQSLGTEHVKFIDRIKFSKRDVVEIERELALRCTTLSTFLETIGLGGIGRVECKMESVDGKVDLISEQQVLILEAIEKVVIDASSRAETGSVLSDYSNDDKSVWRQLRRDLILAGFKSADIERNKQLIYDKLVQLQRSGYIDLDQSSSADDRSDATITFLAHERISFVQPTLGTIYEAAAVRVTYGNNNYKAPSASTVCDASDGDDTVSHEHASPFGPRRNDSPLHAHGSVLPQVPRSVSESQPRQENVRFRSTHRSPNYGVTAPRATNTRGRPLMIDISGGEPARFTTAWKETRQPPKGDSENVPVHMGIKGSGMRSQTERKPPFLETVPVEAVTSNYATNCPKHERKQHSLEKAYTQPIPSNPAMSDPMFDHEVLQGRRSTTTSQSWRYRQAGDMFPPRMRAADLRDNSLPKAARDGNVNMVYTLLMEGYNPEALGASDSQPLSTSEGSTALYLAADRVRLRSADRAHFDCVQMLLRHGANPNPEGSDGKSLLQRLVVSGATEVLRLLLEYRANPQSQGLLPRAASKQNLGLVQLLLEYGADIEEVLDHQTALHCATGNGHARILELLLREGANSGFISIDFWGYDCLHNAIDRGHDECVRLLLLYGASPSATRATSGETALYRACRSGKESIARLLLRRRADPDHGKFFLDRSIHQLKYTDPPLHVVAQSGRASIVRLLLDYGANWRIRNHDGMDTFDFESAMGHTDILEVLRASITDQDGYLHPAAYKFAYGSGFASRPTISSPHQYQRVDADFRPAPRYDDRTVDLAYRDRRASDMHVGGARLASTPEKSRRKGAATRSAAPSTRKQTGSATKGFALGSAAALLLDGLDMFG